VNSLGPLVYAAAAGVYLVLRRQSAAHRWELERAYTRLGVVPPPARPKIEMLEAVLTAIIGFLVSIASAAAIVSYIEAGRVVDLDSGSWILLALSLAGGFTLEILGIRAIREDFRHRRGNTRRHGRSPAGGVTDQ